MTQGRHGGWDGDKASLDFVVDWRLWADELASDREDCLGPRCPNYMESPHRVARIKCDDAELIVANHALYFTDLVTNAGVLPKHDLVIFDEASQCPIEQAMPAIYRGKSLIVSGDEKQLPPTDFFSVRLQNLDDGDDEDDAAAD